MLHVTNHVIDSEADYRGRGRVCCLAQLERGEAFIEQTIVYDATYVECDGRWLFLARAHLLWFRQERQPNPLDQEPANWPARQAGTGSLQDIAHPPTEAIE